MNDSHGDDKPLPAPESAAPPSTVVGDSMSPEPYASAFLAATSLPPGGNAFLAALIRLRLMTPEGVRDFLDEDPDAISRYTDAEALGAELVSTGRLTDYQLARVLAGRTHGLVFGNHRVLDRIGAGAMGEVFLAEHLFLKRRVAIKVLKVDEDCSPKMLERFYSEMEVLASLHHPYIVMAYDAGQLPAPGPGMPSMLYLAMEHVPGGDLHRYVAEHGPAPIPQACEWIRQAAEGLQAAHDRHLVHRDIKPSNLLLGKDNRVKMVDFGLVRQFASRLTDPKALLGTVEFMSPEQSRDPSLVSSQADIYGLGATLFYLISGETPYPRLKRLKEAVKQLQSNRPRRLRSVLPGAPRQLDDLLEKIMDPEPTRRPALPLTVMNALEQFTPHYYERV